MGHGNDQTSRPHSAAAQNGAWLGSSNRRWVGRPGADPTPLVPSAKIWPLTGTSASLPDGAPQSPPSTAHTVQRKTLKQILAKKHEVMVSATLHVMHGHASPCVWMPGRRVACHDATAGHAPSALARRPGNTNAAPNRARHCHVIPRHGAPRCALLQQAAPCFSAVTNAAPRHVSAHACAAAHRAAPRQVASRDHFQDAHGTNNA